MKARTKYNDEQLKEAVKSSVSLRETALKLGLCGRGGGSFWSIKRNIKRLKLDTTHFLGRAWMKGRVPNWSVKPLNDYLSIDGKHISNQQLKKRLIASGLKKDQCEICGQLPIWNNKPLVLQLDHINGNSSDNRLVNLRVVCPHCHSQTSTFCGRRFKLQTDSSWRKRPRPNQRKAERPTLDALRDLLVSHNWVSIGRMYGVSDNAVRKWAKSYGILRSL